MSLFAAPPYSSSADAALLLARAIAGSALAIHGWQKMQNPTNWMGPDAFAPGFLQALAALSEFGGGIALILGLLTPLAALGIACTMGVAAYTHLVMRRDPFVSLTGAPSPELALTYFSIAIILLTLGPGRYSADHRIFGRR